MWLRGEITVMSYLRHEQGQAGHAVQQRSRVHCAAPVEARCSSRQPSGTPASASAHLDGSMSRTSRAPPHPVPNTTSRCLRVRRTRLGKCQTSMCSSSSSSTAETTSTVAGSVSYGSHSPARCEREDRACRCQVTKLTSRSAGDAASQAAASPPAAAARTGHLDCICRRGVQLPHDPAATEVALRRCKLAQQRLWAQPPHGAALRASPA